MDFRLAVMQDLPKIKMVYKEIIKHMDESQIQIWDDSYPCDLFETDIRNKRLYLLSDQNEVVSTFTLCDANAGEKSVKWKCDCNKTFYLERLGVNVNYLKMGIGSLMLTKAKQLARSLGAECLRLFVVDINEPAIRLYCKNGFTKADGTHDEVIEDDFVLHEYGYEAKL